MPSLLSGPSVTRASGTLIVVGIVLAAFNLRPGVTGLSPLLDALDADLGIGARFLAVIGMLPPLAYGLFGLVTPRLAGRLGLLPVVVLAMVLIVAGLALRAVTSSSSVFLLLSALALVGMGIGNVVVPPIIKAYFPTRIGLLSTVHVALLQIGTFVPPLVAVPLAGALGRRGSLLVWAITAVVALIAWVVVTARRPVPALHATGNTVSAAQFLRLLRTPRAWALTLMMGLTSLNNFVLFTWLPLLFVRAGFSAEFSGGMLSLLTAIPFVLGLALPVLAEHVRNPVAPVFVFCACLVAGYLGMAIAPGAAPVAWTVLLGLGISTFPLALTLISLRSATTADAAALSGFVQGLGYTVAATGPVVFALLVESFPGLWPAYGFVLVTVVIKFAVSYSACRPGTI